MARAAEHATANVASHTSRRNVRLASDLARDLRHIEAAVNARTRVVSSKARTRSASADYGAMGASTHAVDGKHRRQPSGLVENASHVSAVQQQRRRHAD
eukprot:2007593-Pyramimonas_sp.AAC.1